MERLGYDALRRPGRRLGERRHRADGAADAAGLARHPHQHAGHRPGRDRQALAVGDPPPAGLSAEERARLGSARLLLRSTASPTRRRWATGRRRCTRSPTRPSAWPPGCSTTTRPAYALIARVFAGAARGPDARRHPRQRHALLADEHGGLVGAALLGEQARLLRAEGRHPPGRVSVFPDEIYPAPRSWAEQAYPNLIHYNRLPKGGHFAAWEQPQLFSEELRAAFRSLTPAPDCESTLKEVPGDCDSRAVRADDRPGARRLRRRHRAGTTSIARLQHAGVHGRSPRPTRCVA